MKRIIFVLSLLVAASSVHAQGIDAKKIYFGAGVGLNDASGFDSAIGFQVFAGLPLAVDLGKANLAVEVGYMDTGNMDFKAGPFSGSAKANGLWSTAVFSLPLQTSLDLVGRIGYDFGDDDGLMIGGGIGMSLANNMDLRFEYVIRDNIDSLQANLVIRQ